jgi:hypothetical protein
VPVDTVLIFGRETPKFPRKLLVYRCHRAQNAFAGVSLGIAIPKLDGFVFASRSAGRNVGRCMNPV